MRHPARVELDLFARPAVGHGDRGRRPAEAELGDREAPEGRVADLDPLASEELAQLREPDALAEEALDDGALGRAVAPAVAPGPAQVRLHPADDGGDQAVIQRLQSRRPAEPLARPAATYRRTVLTLSPS